MLKGVREPQRDQAIVAEFLVPPRKFWVRQLPFAWGYAIASEFYDLPDFQIGWTSAPMSQSTEDVHLLIRWLRFVSRAKGHIAGGILCGLVAGLAYLSLAKPYYTASMTVGPTSAAPAMAGLGNLSSLALGGLGQGLAGKITSVLSGAGSSQPVAPFDAFQSTLTSTVLAEHLVQNQDLMHRIFYNDWNAQDRKWEEPPGVISKLKDFARLILNLPGWHPPDAESVTLYLSHNLEIEPMPGSSLVQLSFEFEDPAAARDLLAAIYADSESIVKNMDYVQSTRLISMMDASVTDESSLPESAKQDLFTFLSQEYQIKLLTTAKIAYAAGVFDPLYVTPRPTWPRPLPVFLIGALAGLLAGLIAYSAGLKFSYRNLLKQPRTRVAAKMSHER